MDAPGARLAPVKALLSLMSALMNLSVKDKRRTGPARFGCAVLLPRKPNPPPAFKWHAAKGLQKGKQDAGEASEHERAQFEQGQGDTLALTLSGGTAQ
jgi:hypothetical protein